MLALALTPQVSWYSSGTFWTGAGAIAATLALFVPIILRLADRRLLIYGLRSQVALLSNDALQDAGMPSDDLRVLVGGHTLTNPHVISMAIANRSSALRDIKADDFQSGRPLIIDTGAQIAQVLSLDTGGSDKPDIPIQFQNTQIVIRPTHINRRQVITLKLLTDGEASLSCPNPSLADVVIRDASNDDYEPNWLVAFAAIGGILIFVGLKGGLANLYFGPISWVGIFLIFIPLTGFLLRMIYRGGGLSRVRPWARPEWEASEAKKAERRARREKPDHRPESAS